jgi:hypothetical protein
MPDHIRWGNDREALTRHGASVTHRLESTPMPHGFPRPQDHSFQQTTFSVLLRRECHCFDKLKGENIDHCEHRIF